MDKMEKSLNELVDLDESLIRKRLTTLRKTPIYKIFDRYFRPEIHNSENIPKRGRALLVPNHAGPIVWDAIALYDQVEKSTGRIAYGLADRAFEMINPLYKLMNSFGTMIGKPKRALELLKHDKFVLVFPGGSVDAAKPYWQRYKLDRVRGFNGCGYMRMALATKSPIVPIAILGSEEANITLADLKPGINSVLDLLRKPTGHLPGSFMKNRYLRKFKRCWDMIPAIPLVLNAIPFPSKINIYVGEVFRPHHFYGDFSLQEFEELRARKKAKILTTSEKYHFMEIKSKLLYLSDIVRAEIQEMIHEHS